MDTDLILVIGIVLLLLSIPSMFSALIDSRAPRTAAVVFVIAGGLIAYALVQRPNHYSVAGVPDVFIRVIGQYFH